LDEVGEPGKLPGRVEVELDAGREGWAVEPEAGLEWQNGESTSFLGIMRGGVGAAPLLASEARDEPDVEDEIILMVGSAPESDGRRARATPGSTCGEAGTSSTSMLSSSWAAGGATGWADCLDETVDRLMEAVSIDLSDFAVDRESEVELAVSEDDRNQGRTSAAARSGTEHVCRAHPSFSSQTRLRPPHRCVHCSSYRSPPRPRSAAPTPRTASDLMTVLGRTKAGRPGRRGARTTGPSELGEGERPHWRHTKRASAG
jgi:hypothetical protein